MTTETKTASKKTASEQSRKTGRRRTAVANVILKPGSGEYLVNGRTIDDYFKTPFERNSAIQPLLITETHKNFDFTCRVQGGGLVGQAGAVSLALARALLETKPELKDTLRANGLLTRDSRMKERKKSGQPGARKRFQFSKR